MFAVLGPCGPMAVNSTELFPGRICGHRGSIDSCLRSTTTVDAPDDEGTLDSLPKPIAAMILPSVPQLPPERSTASHKMTGEPPSIAVFFKLPDAQNPTHCPSGEKKGPRAPSVPGNSLTVI